MTAMRTAIALLALLLAAAAATAAPPEHANGHAHGEGGNDQAADHPREAGEGKGKDAQAEDGATHGNGPGDGDTGVDGTDGTHSQHEPPAPQTDDRAAASGDAATDPAPPEATDRPGRPDAAQGQGPSRGDGETPRGGAGGSSGREPRDKPDDGLLDTQDVDPAEGAVRGHDRAGGDAGLPDDGPTAPPALKPLASSDVRVTPAPDGVVLSWLAPKDPDAQVQVWRRDGDAWTALTVADGAGSFLDRGATPMSEYRVTWSSEGIAADALLTAVPTLPLAPAGAGSTDAWGAIVLWAGVAVFATVRARAPRRVLELRVASENLVLPLLSGLPGVDNVALERVVGLGLRTVGQLRAADAYALAFWAGLPVATVRAWHETLDLLQWSALPPGAAERLALVGHGSLARVAQADPADLHVTLAQNDSVLGPGLPSDPSEVATWVAEARQALGLPLRTPPTAQSQTAGAVVAS